MEEDDDDGDIEFVLTDENGDFQPTVELPKGEDADVDDLVIEEFGADATIRRPKRAAAPKRTALFRRSRPPTSEPLTPDEAIERATPSQVKRWQRMMPTDLRKIRAKSVVEIEPLRMHLEHMLQSEMSGENLRFLLNLRELRIECRRLLRYMQNNNLHEFDERCQRRATRLHDMTLEIMRLHLDIGAPAEINIAAATREETLAAFAEARSTESTAMLKALPRAFDASRSEVEHMLRMDKLGRWSRRDDVVELFERVSQRIQEAEEKEEGEEEEKNAKRNDAQ